MRRVLLWSPDSHMAIKSQAWIESCLLCDECRLVSQQHLTCMVYKCVERERERERERKREREITNICVRTFTIRAKLASMFIKSLIMLETWKLNSWRVLKCHLCQISQFDVLNGQICQKSKLLLGDVTMPNTPAYMWTPSTNTYHIADNIGGD